MVKKAKVIFTDLDNTILFSKNHTIDDDYICSEYKLGKEQGYTLSKLLDKIYEINAVSHKDIYIIPVTVRSIEQYMRTRFFDDCQYAITTSGGTLIKNRYIDRSWDERTKNNLRHIENYIYDTFVYLNGNCSNQGQFCRLVDGCYVFLRDNNKDRLKELERDLIACNQEQQIETDIDVINTGTKLTVLPSFLNKGNAIKNFIKYILVEENGYNSIETWGFGDSYFDISMLNNVDHAFCSNDIKDMITNCRDIKGFDSGMDKELLSLLYELEL